MRKQVAIIFGSARLSMSFRLTAAGISEQAVSRQWQFQLLDLGASVENGLARLQWILEHPVDGAIAIGLLEKDAYVMQMLSQWNVPAVHAGELHPDRSCHEVRAPNMAIGRLAAEHLLERGLRHFAFIGDRQGNSLVRCRGFTDALAEASYDHTATLLSNGLQESGEHVAEFLTSLPKPVGIMAVNDQMGWMVAREALHAGIPIPEQLALIGFGNDDPWCTLATPPMSSIAAPGRLVGQRALTMLDHLMSGRPTPMTVDVILKEIVVRQSTDVMHTDSPEIAAAIGYIRRHHGLGMTVQDVADFAGISISSLERGMKAVLGRTPLQEMLRMRFDTARELLANTDMPMKSVAARCGFAAGRRFSTAIRKATGISPSQYRAKHRSYQVLDETGATHRGSHR